MNIYSNDPRWVSARYNSNCQCGQAISKGTLKIPADKILYYPIGRKVLCAKCGEKAFSEFSASRADEAMMSGESW